MALRMIKCGCSIPPSQRRWPEKRAYAMPTLASTPRAIAMPKLANAIMGMSYKMIVDTKMIAARNMAEKYSGLIPQDVNNYLCIIKVVN